MKNTLLIVAGMLLFTACNESRRGNDANVGEDRDEAAAESNTDKFAGKKQRDAEFVFAVVESNYGEIKLAGLGNQRSRNAEVKRVAQMLLTDHGASLNELKTLAQAKAISVPVEETEAARRDLEKIAKQSEKDFDAAWCEKMTSLHESTIDRFEKRLNDTEDAELKTYITKTLPVLKKHLEALKAVDQKMKR